MRFPNIRSSMLCLVGSVLVFSFGCTTPPKAEDEVTAEEGASDEVAQAGDAGDKTKSEDDLLTDDAKLTDEKAAESIEKPATTHEKSAEVAPTPAPVEPAPIVSSDSSERVVRFVLADKTPAYSQADEKSTQVGIYDAGDPLVVKLNGDWAELTENYYVKASALSSKVVPRKRMDPWSSAR